MRHYIGGIYYCDFDVKPYTRDTSPDQKQLTIAARIFVTETATLQDKNCQSRVSRQLGNMAKAPLRFFALHIHVNFAMFRIKKCTNNVTEW